VTALLVNIDVDDLEKARAFYTRVFGLTLGRSFGASGLELLGSSAPIYLLVKPPGSAAFPGGESRRDYARHWTPVHLDFVVEDIDAAVQRALEAGAVLEAPVKAGGWGEIALMSDPFGHGFCLVAFRGRGYDEVAESAPEA
jgi:predicted enzyme related to lactoylglutathione lyase